MQTPETLSHKDSETMSFKPTNRHLVLGCGSGDFDTWDFQTLLWETLHLWMCQEGFLVASKGTDSWIHRIKITNFQGSQRNGAQRLYIKEHHPKSHSNTGLKGRGASILHHQHLLLPWKPCRTASHFFMSLVSISEFWDGGVWLAETRSHACSLAATVAENADSEHFRLP